MRCIVKMAHVRSRSAVRLVQRAFDRGRCEWHVHRVALGERHRADVQKEHAQDCYSVFHLKPPRRNISHSRPRFRAPRCPLFDIRHPPFVFQQPSFRQPRNDFAHGVFSPGFNGFFRLVLNGDAPRYTASKSGRPSALAWARAGNLNSCVATAIAATPEFSSRIVSCKLHVVHDPQSASASMTASTPRSFAITASGARLVKVGFISRTTRATP